MAAVEDFSFLIFNIIYLLITGTVPVNLSHRTLLLITCFYVTIHTQEEISLLVSIQ